MENRGTLSFLLSNRTWLLPILPTALLAIILNRHGLRLTYDSHQFLNAAKSFGTVGLLLDDIGNPMVLSSLGFPVFLSLFSHPQKAYAVLAPVFYWASVSCWCYIAKTKFLNQTNWALFPLVLGVPLFLPFLFLWSEGLFLFFFSLGFALLEKGKSSSLRQQYLIWMTVCFSISITFRYAGMFLIIPILLWELASAKSNQKEDMVTSLGAVLLLVAGILSRNWVLTATLFGARAEGALPFSEILFRCSSVLSNWIVPRRYLGVGASLLTLGILLLLLLYEQRRYAFWIVIYFFSIVWAATETEIEHDERLFIPIYPLLIIALTSAWLKKRDSSLVNKWQLGFYFVWSLYVLSRFIKNLWFWFV